MKSSVPYLLLSAWLAAAGSSAAATPPSSPAAPVPSAAELSAACAASAPARAGVCPAAPQAASAARAAAIWSGLSPAARQQLLERAMRVRGAVLDRAASLRPAVVAPRRLVLPQRFANHIATRRAAATSVLGAGQLTAQPVKKETSLRKSLSGPDNDLDGLPDDFENAVADNFTPIYHVSAGEQPGTGFALFGDFVPETPVETFGSVPPISYFRVTPLGFANDASGTQFGFLEIDYLTLWNRDDGLVVGDDCFFLAGLLGGVVGIDLAGLADGLGGHVTDDEHSAVLVAAPTSGSQFSTDPAAYSAYSYYTAAHEGTFFDHGAFLSPSSPVPAGNHLNLWLSLSKHSTYTGNPDELPLFPAPVIDLTNGTLLALWSDGELSDDDFAFYTAAADSVFFSCIVEHFSEQGPSVAATRINVGEESHPLNGSTFIQDSQHLAPKLNTPLWVIQ